MKAFFFFFSFLLIQFSNSQSITKSFSYIDTSYTCRVELQTDNSLKVAIFSGKDSVCNFNIWTDDFLQFRKTFVLEFCKKINGGAVCTAGAEKEKLETFATTLFFDYQGTQAKSDNQPIAGVFKILDSARLFKIYKAKDSKKVYETANIINLKVINVSAEINEGYLENIKVYCKVPQGLKIFTLPYAIGISSVGNFKQYYNRKLFSMDSPEFFKNKYKKIDSLTRSGEEIDSQYWIALGDVLEYDYALGVDRRDYSPKNTVLKLLAGESKTLYKEEANKLFEAHIFTDFVGLQNEKPNGLIQTEVRKRINTNSKQHLIEYKLIRWVFKSFGLFQYIMPSVVLSKIEEHNKRYILGDLDSVRNNPSINDTSKYNKYKKRFSTALELYRYEQFSAGATINLANLNNHDAKYHFQLNFGAYLGITQLSDSLTIGSTGVAQKTGFTKDYSINTLQFYPEIKVVFLPEERFNFSIGNKFIFFKPVNPDIELMKTNKYDPTILAPIKSAWINSFEMLMSIKVNQEIGSKLFGRLTFNSEMGNINNNFAQLQLGYATYILGRK